MLVAQVAIFFERAVNHFFELGRQIRIDAHRRDGFAIEDRIENYTGRIAAKWWIAGPGPTILASSSSSLS